MIIVRLFLILILWTTIDSRFIMYYTDDRPGTYSTFDCIYAYLEENHRDIAGPYSRSYHLIPYCRRPDDNEILNDKINSNVTINEMINFSHLKKQGVTSTQLLEWMAPIDVVERYEDYNENMNEVFNNCSLPWFGSECQYRFDLNVSHSFSDIVNVTFTGRLKFCRKIENETCYPFLLNCYRGPSSICLDWREICDGRFDCINGEDEILCEQLELNECIDGEYRCHYGGQCIPFGFVDDGQKNVDCLDGSDEVDATIQYDTVLSRLDCHTIPTFLCEERSCRYPHSYSCGDGHCGLFQVVNYPSKICFNRRFLEIIRLLLTTKDQYLNKICHDILLCLLRIPNDPVNFCDLTLSNNLDINDCESFDKYCLFEWVAVPSKPILFGFFQFIYLTNRSIAEFKQNILPDYVCFNPKRCPGLLSTIINIKLMNDLTCSHISDIVSVQTQARFDRIEFNFKDAVQRCLTIGTQLSCSHSSLYHCPLSLKCISYHRLVDGFNDCYHGEDESYPSCQQNDSSRFICPSNSSKCLSIVALGNLQFDCLEREDELIVRERSYIQRPPFPYFCNNQKEPVSIFRAEMDEKNCELWPCNNPYVRCNKNWNCLNGIDELNCPNSKCSTNEHECALKNKSNSICLSIEHLYDKYLDNCSLRNDIYRDIYFDNRTGINTSEYVSWIKTKCITLNHICPPHLLQSDIDNNECLYQSNEGYKIYLTGNLRSIDKTAICWIFATNDAQNPSPFATTTDLGFFPHIDSTTRSLQSVQIGSRPMPTMDILRSWYCNRGILVRYNSNINSLNSTEIDKCLCPPSYFGSRCQWQNQRISLTLKFVAHSVTSANAIFQVIIMLIDQNRLIMPYHEQIIFVSKRDCSTKFNIYLLYPDRPKNNSIKYSIRVDIYHKMTLKYYGSWYLSIPFQFLPVNRLATELSITDIDEIDSCSLVCGQHGRCNSYQNNKTFYFCQCDSGYTGNLCNIKHECNCSNDSLCISPSICVCPLNKFGTRCFLKNLICQSLNNPCKNNGLCIANDDRITEQRFTCICATGYSGETCEINDNRIDIQFDETMIDTISNVFIHLITMFKDKHHERITIFKKIPFNQNGITLYVEQPFHILLTELINRTYYLTIVREMYIRSENISTQIKSNQRCNSINELLNATWLNYSLYHRVKYYPYVCRYYKDTMCFYDEVYMCLCDRNRFSNCFEFNHTMVYDCQGKNDCQNDGRCLVNNATCPTMSICICPECFYGRKCQFSTQGFILSLDSILGYQIKPNIPISQQPSIIKLSIGIITFMYIFGIISAISSIITFRMKRPREVGCGWYLLTSSSICLCALTLLKIKFWNLILFQKGLLTNRSLLSFSCRTTDASLKICLAIDNWLNGCVMIERTYAAHIGVQFHKSKSTTIAKRIIFIILLMTIMTYTHDLFHYGLIDDFDVDEKRTWCFVRYSTSVDIYNRIINIFHFIVPFFINIISSIFLLISTARNRSRIHPQIGYMQHLQQEIKQDKYILFPPCLLILLNLPRLIITFVSDCMKSPRDPLLFLIGYFVSFVPIMVHFYVFVRPSKQYMRIYNTSIQKIIRQLRLKFSR